MLNMSRIAMTAAALGMAIAPIAATANTRAADNGAVYSAPVSAPGKGRADDGEKLVGQGIILAVFAVAAAVGGIVIATDGGNNDTASPGGN